MDELPFGRALGLLFCFAGAALVGAHLFLSSLVGFTHEFLLLGPTLVGLGATLVTLPGDREVTWRGIRNGTQHPRDMEAGAPAPHKVAWLVATLVSTAAGLRWLGIL